jgi:hypothetical protein
MNNNARKSSGLSTQRSGMPQPTTPSEEDMYNMPLDKLRELANKQLADRQ